jgi:hypothetical protein
MRQSIGGVALVGPAADLRTVAFCLQSLCNRCASAAAEFKDYDIQREK